MTINKVTDTPSAGSDIFQWSPLPLPPASHSDRRGARSAERPVRPLSGPLEDTAVPSGRYQTGDAETVAVSAVGTGLGAAGGP